MNAIGIVEVEGGDGEGGKGGKGGGEIFVG